MFLRSQNHPSSKGHAEAQTLTQLHFDCAVLPSSLTFISCLENVFFASHCCQFAIKIIPHISPISFHGITEWPGLAGTLKIILFQPSTVSRDTFHQTWLLRVLSNLALNMATDGASTFSGTLFQCCTTLTVDFFLISNLNLHLLSYRWKPFPFVCHYMLLQIISLHFSYRLPSCTGKPQLGLLEVLFFPDWKIPIFLAFFS